MSTQLIAAFQSFLETNQQHMTLTRDEARAALEFMSKDDSPHEFNHSLVPAPGYTIRKAGMVWKLVSWDRDRSTWLSEGGTFTNTHRVWQNVVGLYIFE